MPVTDPETRRRLEAEGAVLDMEQTTYNGYNEFWFRKRPDYIGLAIDLYTPPGTAKQGIMVNLFAFCDKFDEALRWLLAWRAPHLLDAEAEIARLQAEADQLRRTSEAVLDDLRLTLTAATDGAIHRWWPPARVIEVYEGGVRRACDALERALRGGDSASD